MNRVNLFTAPAAFALLFATFTSTGTAHESTFARLDFDNLVSIEVPRNWTYLDENVREHINTMSEAVGRAASLPIGQGDNVILVAANAYMGSRSAAATMRLSVRKSSAITQADMQALSTLPAIEVAKGLSPLVNDVKKALLSIDGVISSHATAVRVVKSASMLCIFLEFRNETNDGIDLAQTWICPTGDRNIKLSTSYKDAHKQIFKPIIDLIHSSLRVR